MRLRKTWVVKKIQKIKSNSNAKLKITIVFLSEKQQKWVPTYIYSISDTNFMSSSRFEGARFKKAPREVSKRGPISKKKRFPTFLAKAKI